MANFLSVGIPSAILGALGSGQEQRERADRLAQIEAQRRYQAERLGLDRGALAETRRQPDLKYGPVTVNVPGVGEITAQREFIPSLIAAASAREKDISPEEVTALTGYRDRALLPAGGTINRGGIPWDPTLEAEASRQAMNQTRVLPKSTEGISPMTVDLPQTSVPRQSFERVMTEAAQVRKEREGEERKNKQGLSNARYRQIYSTAISQKVPHPVADAFAIDIATKEFGIAPEREAFVAAPTEQRQSTDREAIAQRIFNTSWNKLDQNQMATVDETLQKEKIAVATASGQGRAGAFGDIRQLPVIDTKNENRLTLVNSTEINRANQEEPGRYVPAAQGQQALNRTALVEDIRGAIDLTRESLSRLTTDFTAEQAAQISLMIDR